MAVAVKELPLPRGGCVDFIFHVADTHIRLGDDVTSRRDEYEHVFRALFLSAKSHPCVAAGTAVVCVCGDVLHVRRSLDINGLDLFLMLMDGLSELGPVFCIAGNHDRSREGRDILASAFALMNRGVSTDPNKQPVVYLDTTGLYRCGDVGFGLVAIQDALQQKRRPPYPCASGLEGCAWKVALFHGAVTGACELPSGQTLKGEPLTWFGAGYDAALLGDIHLCQVHGMEAVSDEATPTGGRGYSVPARGSGDLPWAFPGSLVQQDHGEPLFGHGYLLWSVRARRVSSHHVVNRVGRVTVRAHPERGWVCQVGSNAAAERDMCLTPDEAVRTLPWFPSAMIVRVTEPRNTACDVEAAREALEGTVKVLGIVPHVLPARTASSKGLPATFDTQCEQHNAVLAECDSPEAWIHDIERLSPQPGMSGDAMAMLRDPGQMALPAASDHPAWGVAAAEVAKRNLELGKLLTEIGTAVADGAMRGARPPLRLVRIDWLWILAYGDACWIDFLTLRGHVALLNAANRMGKTSVFDIISQGLFAVGIPSRANSGNSQGLMSHYRPLTTREDKHLRPRIVTVVDVGGVHYRLTRVFEKQGKTGMKQTKSYVQRVGEARKIAEGAHAIKAWVTSNLGTPEDFRLSAMLTSGNDGDLLSGTKESDQIRIIDNAIGNTVAQKTREALRSAVQAHKMTQQLVIRSKRALDGHKAQKVLDVDASMRAIDLEQATTRDALGTDRTVLASSIREAESALSCATALYHTACGGEPHTACLIAGGSAVVTQALLDAGPDEDGDGQDESHEAGLLERVGRLAALCPSSPPGSAEGGLRASAEVSELLRMHRLHEPSPVPSVSTTRVLELDVLIREWECEWETHHRVDVPTGDVAVAAAAAAAAHDAVVRLKVEMQVVQLGWDAASVAAGVTSRCEPTSDVAALRDQLVSLRMNVDYRCDQPGLTVQHASDSLARATEAVRILLRATPPRCPLSTQDVEAKLAAMSLQRDDAADDGDVHEDDGGADRDGDDVLARAVIRLREASDRRDRAEEALMHAEGGRRAASARCLELAESKPPPPRVPVEGHAAWQAACDDAVTAAGLWLPLQGGGGMTRALTALHDPMRDVASAAAQDAALAEELEGELTRQLAVLSASRAAWELAERTQPQYQEGCWACHLHSGVSLRELKDLAADVEIADAAAGTIRARLEAQVHAHSSPTERTAYATGGATGWRQAKVAGHAATSAWCVTTDALLDAAAGWDEAMIRDSELRGWTASMCVARVTSEEADNDTARVRQDWHDALHHLGSCSRRAERLRSALTRRHLLVDLGIAQAFETWHAQLASAEARCSQLSDVEEATRRLTAATSSWADWDAASTRARGELALCAERQRDVMERATAASAEETRTREAERYATRRASEWTPWTTQHREQSDAWARWGPWRDLDTTLARERAQAELREARNAVAQAATRRLRRARVTALRLALTSGVPAHEAMRVQGTWLEAARSRALALAESHGVAKVSAEKQEQSRAMGAYAQLLRDRLAELKALQTAMDGYRSRLYTATVAPLLEAEVNGVLSQLLPSQERSGREVRIAFVVRWDEVKCVFLWRYKYLDGSHVELDYKNAGGHQKSSMSLAMRIALARIGRNGMVSRHLFVDEGFTATDAHNMEAVPAFLKALVQSRFESVLLVSHVDSIKDCADVEMGISRHETRYVDAEGRQQVAMVSRLQWGSPPAGGSIVPDADDDDEDGHDDDEEDEADASLLE